VLSSTTFFSLSAAFLFFLPGSQLKSAVINQLLSVNNLFLGHHQPLVQVFIFFSLGSHNRLNQIFLQLGSILPISSQCQLRLLGFGNFSLHLIHLLVHRFGFKIGLSNLELPIMNGLLRLDRA